MRKMRGKSTGCAGSGAGRKKRDCKVDRNWAEVFADKGQEPEVSALTAAVEALGYKVTGID